jgi:hypothetical protein
MLVHIMLEQSKLKVGKRMSIPKAVIFLHISKTGGSTLRSIIKRQYPKDSIYDLDPSYFISEPALYEVTVQERVNQLRLMTEQEKARFLCFLHPMAYGLHLILPNDMPYFTFLRDPIDHFISSYYFAVNKHDHVQHKSIVENSLSIEDYAEHFPLDNLQTRRLSGCDPIDTLRGIPLPGDALSKAKEHLAEMPCFGLTERYNESLLILKERFAWGNINYQAQNVAPKRMALSDIGASFKKKLERDLALDLELYSFAQNLFQEHLKASSLDMHKALVQFNRENQRLAKSIILKKKIRSALRNFLGGRK